MFNPEGIDMNHGTKDGVRKPLSAKDRAIKKYRARVSALRNAVIQYTVFTSVAGSEKREGKGTLREIAKVLENDGAPRVAHKDWLSLISFATYGDHKSSKGSYKHDENLIATTALKIDHDHGAMGIMDGVDFAEAIDVVALFHTSDSHLRVTDGNPDADPRWHGFFPMSKSYSGQALQRQKRLFAQLCETEDIEINTESKTDVQGFFIGVTEKAKHNFTRLSKGRRFIDQVLERMVKAGELDEPELGRDDPWSGDRGDGKGVGPGEGIGRATARETLNKIDPDVSYPDWYRAISAAKWEGCTFEDVHEWSAKGTKYRGPEAGAREVRQKFNDSDGVGPDRKPVTIATLKYLAKEYPSEAYRKEQEKKEKKEQAAVGKPDWFQSLPLKPKPGDKFGLLMTKRGLYKIGKGTEAEGPKELWVSPAFHVQGIARDAAGQGYGKLLLWIDPDGRERNQLVSDSDLVEPRELVRSLLDNGLGIGVDVEQMKSFAKYLSQPIDGRVLIAHKSGWASDNQVFVMPHTTIGMKLEEPVVFQANKEGFTRVGDLNGWRKAAALIEGSTRVMFAVCMAFAAPVMRLAGLEPIGVHVFGESSKGKTLALKMANSVFGEGLTVEELRSWNSTANALEATAEARNDLLLSLDEVKQANPKEVQQAVYRLMNGRGKERLNSDSTSKPARNWYTLVLSNGEHSLGNMALIGGERADAGASVRILDVPLPEQGMLEKIEGFENVQEVAGAVLDIIRSNRGVVGHEWVEHLTNGPKEIAGRIAKHADQLLIEHAQGDSQVKRVLHRVLFVGAVGEYAIERGLLPWSKESAVDAALAVFNAWIANRGGTKNKEGEDAIDRLKGFLNEHKARFTTSEFEQAPRDRAGHIDETGGDYWIFPSVMKEQVFKGMDSVVAIRNLVDAGWVIRPRSGANLTWKKRLPDMMGETTRVYVVRLR